MTKKAAMVVFMFSATIVNIILTIVCFTILMLLYTAFVAPHISENMNNIGFPVIFFASLGSSFFIYQKALKVFLKKHPIDK